MDLGRKPLNPKAKEKEADPVLKEGNLLSNTFNRAVRSCFYTVQKYYDSIIPVGDVSDDVLKQCEEVIFDFEEAMFKKEFHNTINIIEKFMKSINQRWSKSNAYYEDTDPQERKQALIDAFHQVKVATVLMHPIAPQGTEKVRNYLKLSNDLWNWDYIFEPLHSFMEAPDNHKLTFLEPRVDFFDKHPSQVK